MRFPRSKERGLIEASLSVALEASATNFPRSKERGLIEAWLGTPAIVLSRSFRVRKSAASLKPVSPAEVTLAITATFRVRKSAASLKPNG